MKTCSACNKIFPDESFYREGSWCRDCRTLKRKEGNTRDASHRAAHKMITNKAPFDPTAFGKLHCEHIANYLKRNIEKFERKTNMEAPPELTAIYQLAKKLTDDQQQQLTARGVTIVGSRVTRIPAPRQCEYCGKTYTPRHNLSKCRWCSPQCRHTARDEANPEAVRIRQARYLQRIREQKDPGYDARQAERKSQTRARKKQQQAKQQETKRRRAQNIERAQQAYEMRLAGCKWQTIADTLGYGNPAGPWCAINDLLKIDPTTLRPQGRQGRRPSARSDTTPHAAIAGT